MADLFSRPPDPAAAAEEDGLRTFRERGGGTAGLMFGNRLHPLEQIIQKHR